MNKTIKLNTVEDLTILLAVCRKAVDDSPHRVTIAPLKKNISQEQRALYWKWLTEFASHLGDDTKDGYHLLFKERYLLNIFYRDDLPDDKGRYGFRNMADSIKVLANENRTQYNAIRSKVIELISITQANTKQMAEYMQEIKVYGLSLGVSLTEPDLKGLI